MKDIDSFNVGDTLSLDDIVAFAQRDGPFVLLITDMEYDYEFIRKHINHNQIYVKIYRHNKWRILDENVFYDEDIESSIRKYYTDRSYEIIFID